MFNPMSTYEEEKNKRKYNIAIDACGFGHNINCNALVHEAWCFASDQMKNYLALPWYKKLFKKNPRTYI